MFKYKVKLVPQEDFRPREVTINNGESVYSDAYVNSLRIVLITAVVCYLTVMFILKYYVIDDLNNKIEQLEKEKIELKERLNNCNDSGDIGDILRFR